MQSSSSSSSSADTMSVEQDGDTIANTFHIHASDLPLDAITRSSQSTSFPSDAIAAYNLSVELFNEVLPRCRMSQSDRFGPPDDPLPDQRAQFLRCAESFRRAMINEWVYFIGPYESIHGMPQRLPESFPPNKRMDPVRLSAWYAPLQYELGYKFVSMKQPEYKLSKLINKFKSIVDGHLFFSDQFLMYLVANDEIYGQPGGANIDEEMHERYYDTSFKEVVDYDGVNWSSRTVQRRFGILTYMKHTPVEKRTWAHIYYLLYDGDETAFLEQLLVYRNATAYVLSKIAEHTVD